MKKTIILISLLLSTFAFAHYYRSSIVQRIEFKFDSGETVILSIESNKVANIEVIGKYGKRCSVPQKELQELCITNPRLDSLGVIDSYRKPPPKDVSFGVMLQGKSGRPVDTLYFEKVDEYVWYDFWFTDGVYTNPYALEAPQRERLKEALNLSIENSMDSITNSQNQQVDPTVKTPVESGKVQGTAGHP